MIASGPKVNDSLAIRINDVVKKAESNLEYFKLAHREHVKRILEYTSGEEEEISLAIGKYKEDLKEMVEHVQDVLLLHLDFKHKLQVSR